MIFVSKNCSMSTCLLINHLKNTTCCLFFFYEFSNTLNCPALNSTKGIHFSGKAQIIEIIKIWYINWLSMVLVQYLMLLYMFLSISKLHKYGESIYNDFTYLGYHQCRCQLLSPQCNDLNYNWAPYHFVCLKTHKKKHFWHIF